jgi:hypothetical protein
MCRRPSGKFPVETQGSSTDLNLYIANLPLARRCCLSLLRGAEESHLWIDEKFVGLRG